jgi:5-methylcytosine-specific restriction endonuclease McrA
MNKISYYSLLEKKPEQSLSYLEKLSTKEWSEKRNKIITRDECTCDICKLKATIFKNGIMFREKTQKELEEFKRSTANSWYDSVLPEFKNKYDRDILPEILKNFIIKPEPVILQVHHKYYVINNLPWEYPDDSLITLCSDCHQNLHNNNNIPIYSDNSKNIQLEYTKCTSCNGSGYLKEYHYYMNGICFDCNGNKYIELK